MTATDYSATSNVIAELYFEQLNGLGLLAALDRVPFAIQQRKGGFTPKMRCMAVLASLAQRCPRLTDWTLGHRLDTRLQHWMDDRIAPHPSTLSRTLAAADAQTIEVLRQEILVPLTDQVLLSPPTRGPVVFIDVDNKGLPAEGATYQNTTTGRMADATFARGYRLHLLSLSNCYPLEMALTGADAHAVPSAVSMIRRLWARTNDRLRSAIVFRGDSNHGSVRFIRVLDHYGCGYLLKAYNTSTARNLWRDHGDVSIRRIVRADRADLLAKEVGATELTGMSRKTRPGKKDYRRACHATVPRVVVYHEDPAQVNADKTPECFALLTTLPGSLYDATALLEEAYLPRGGTIENIFCQLDQAFAITHLRSRTFYGNWLFLMLCLIAAILTQWVRHDALDHGDPVPAGLQETLTAAAQCGVRLLHDPQAGCTVADGLPNAYTETFRTALRCSYQQRFRFVA